jgi:membrane fusion protein (multidrug efflux system)
MSTQLQDRRSKWRKISPPAILAIVALHAAFLFSDCAKQVQAGAGFSLPPMPVEIAQASVQKVTDRFEAVGTIEAMEAITVVSEIDGAVVSLPFQEGTYIRKGEVIALLDDSQLAAELARATALHEQSHVMYERVKSVVDQKAGTPQDLDDAAAGLKVADANLAMAKARYAKTRVLAPFDGIIGARKVSTGAFLRTGQTIAELANIDDIRVNFSAPERFLSKLNRGAEVAVSTTAFPGYTLNGKIIAIEPVLDPRTRSARVVARVSNPGRKFRSGMSANVATVLSERTDAITIPNEAVFANGDQSFVYRIGADSTAARVAVKLGTRLADVVEVVDGLAPGTNIVRAGHQKLFNGAKVIPVFAQKADSANH